METFYECWPTEFSSGSLSVPRRNEVQATVKNAESETQARAAESDPLDHHHLMSENRSNVRAKDERETEEEDGVHGDRMKPLASFDVNRPSLRTRFQIRDPSIGDDGLPNKVSGIKSIRRPRLKLNSSSATGLSILDDCKENNGGLVPLCPGKTRIRGMKPKNSSPKASSYWRAPRTYGKKRSRLKNGEGEIGHAVQLALGSTDHCERGGMDLLLMALDSGLIEVEESQQQDTEVFPGTSEVIVKPEPREEREVQYTNEEVSLRSSIVSTSSGERILPCTSKSAKELPVSRKYDHIQPDAEDEDSEDTADDPIIPFRASPRGLRKSFSPLKREYGDEDSDTPPESCHRVTLSTKADFIHEDDDNEICVERAERWSNFEVEAIKEPVDPGLPLHASGDKNSAGFIRILQPEGCSVSDSAEKCNSTCLETSVNRLSNSNLPMENNTSQCHQERFIDRSESSNSLRVFHEPSLIIAHDIRPSLIQPVKIVGRLNRCMVQNSDKGIDTSPMEMDVGIDEVIEESQAREHTGRRSSIPQICKSKKRKTPDRVSAFRAVRMGKSADTVGDRVPPAVAISCHSESAFRKFQEPAQCNSGALKMQGEKVEACREESWDRAEDRYTYRQAGLQQKMVISSSTLDSDTCQNIYSGSTYMHHDHDGKFMRPSQCAPGDDGKLSVSHDSMFSQERSDSGLDCNKRDDALNAPPAVKRDDAFGASPALTTSEVVKFDGPVKPVPDLVTVTRVVDEHRELSSTLSHTLQSDSHCFWMRNRPEEPLIASGYLKSDLAAKLSGPVGKRKRRNVPLVASHFQDSKQAKTNLSNPFFESGESLGKCAVQVSASAGTAGGSGKVDTDCKGSGRMRPTKFQQIRPRTKVLLPESLGNPPSFLDSNSSADKRSEIILSDVTYNSMPGCFTRGGTAVKGIKRKRGHKKDKQESLKSRRSMSMAGKFKRLPEPSGFLGEFNPGIIQRVRNSQQVHAILGALVGVASFKVVSNTSVIYQSVSNVTLDVDPNSCQVGRNEGSEVGPIDVKQHHLSGLTATAEKGNLCSGYLYEDRGEISSVGVDCIGTDENEREYVVSQLKVDDENAPQTEELLCETQGEVVKSFDYYMPDDPQPSRSSTYVQTCNNQGKNRLESDDFCPWEPSKPEDSDTPLEAATVDPNKDRRVRTLTQTPGPAPAEVAGLAAQWLELLTLDIKGRLSALKRSRRRVRTLLVSGQLGNTKVTPVDHLGVGEVSRAAENRKMFSDQVDSVTSASEQTRLEFQLAKWRAMFTNMDGVLCMEAAKLESNLWQIQQMVVLCQDPKHFLASGPGVPIVPHFSAGKENCPPPSWPFSTDTMVPEVAVAASAASVLSTASFRHKS